MGIKKDAERIGVDRVMSEEKIMVYKVKCSKCGDPFLMFTTPQQKPANPIKCTDCIDGEKRNMLQKRTLVESGSQRQAREIFAGLGEHQFDVETRIVEVE